MLLLGFPTNRVGFRNLVPLPARTARLNFSTEAQVMSALVLVAAMGQIPLAADAQNNTPEQIVAPPPAVQAPPAASVPLAVSRPSPPSVALPRSSPGQTASTTSPASPKLTGSAAQSGASKPKRPFAIGNKFSRTVQTATGITFVSQIISNEIASRVASKKLGGHVKVRMQLYGLTDLLAGKIKSVTVKGDGCSYKQMPLGQVTLSSATPIWFDWHKLNGKTVGLREPIYVSIAGSLRQEDVCKALSSEAVTRSLRGLRLDLPGLGDQQLEILDPKVSLQEKRITISSKMVTKGASADTGIDMTLSAMPVLNGSKILLTDMVVSCPDIMDPTSFSKFVQDLFNPIIDFGRYDRSDHAFRLEKFTIEKDRVLGDGNLLLVPRTTLAGNKASDTQLVK